MFLKLVARMKYGLDGYVDQTWMYAPELFVGVCVAIVYFAARFRSLRRTVHASRLLKEGDTLLITLDQNARSNLGAQKDTQASCEGSETRLKGNATREPGAILCRVRYALCSFVRSIIQLSPSRPLQSCARAFRSTDISPHPTGRPAE